MSLCVSLQVALKVNCPTDNRMAACLKMTDPVHLTMAGTLSMASSPDRKTHSKPTQGQEKDLIVVLRQH